MKKIRLTLDKHLLNRNLKQFEFAEMSGLRTATISQLVNNKYERIQLDHLLTIMETLDITDFNNILEIVDE